MWRMGFNRAVWIESDGTCVSACVLVCACVWACLEACVKVGCVLVKVICGVVSRALWQLCDNRCLTPAFFFPVALIAYHVACIVLEMLDSRPCRSEASRRGFYSASIAGLLNCLLT